jgi:hypothetical protein
MKHLLIAATLFLCCLTGRSQQVVDVNTNNFPLSDPSSAINNVTGLIYQPIKFVKVTAGTPFFKEEWMKARLFDANGESYASHSVRLNLFDNDVNFLDANGTEMVTTTPVKKIQLTDTTNGTQYLFVLGDQIPGADKALARVWLEVLVNDRVSLCRQIKKIMHETPAYRDATTQEEILDVDHYFVRMNDTFIQIKGWSDLVQLFTDKKAAVDEYTHDHHLKGKSADDYTKLVQYYNSLKNASTAGAGNSR